MSKRTRLYLIAMSLFFIIGIALTLNVQESYAADSCSGAGETCRATIPDSTSSTGYRVPTGYDCTFRGTCSGQGTACCKPISSSTVATPGAQQPSGGGTSFTNPLQFQTVDKLLSQLMGALQKIIVTLSLLMIVYGAVLYVISGGGKQIETAKGAITAALVGLAIGLAAPSFLKEISIILGWGPLTLVWLQH